MSSFISRYEVPPTLFPPLPPMGQEADLEAEIRNCFTFPPAGAKQKIVFLIESAGAVGFYRGWLPARELARTGEWEVKVAWGRYREPLVPVLEAADVIVLSVPNDRKLLSLLQRIAKTGRTLIVVDIDDRLDVVPLQNPSYPFWKERYPVLEEFLKIADIVTTPSHEIRAHYQATGQAPLEKLLIVPNFVDEENPVWTEPAAQPDRVTLGFTGSYSHLGDLAVIEKPLQSILAKHSGVCYVTYGPIELHHALDLPRSQAYWQRCRPLSTYASVLRSWQVGLCPLEESDFNAGKSPIKPVEMIAAGVYPVCSDWGPYRHLANQIDSWAKESRGWDLDWSVLPVAASPDAWVWELTRGIQGDALAARRMLLLTEYASTYCLSGQLGALSTLYQSARETKVSEERGDDCW